MGTGCNDRELELHGGCSVPPTRRKGGLVATQAIVDVLPFVNTTVGEARGDEINIDGWRVGQAGRVPGDIEGVSARNGHSRSGVDIESASSAGYKATYQNQNARTRDVLRTIALVECMVGTGMSDTDVSKASLAHIG